MAAKPQRRPSASRFVLQLALTILLVALAAYAFQKWLGTEARLQKLLDQEARALGAADSRRFMALQDQTDIEWWQQQQKAIELRAMGKEQGEAWASKPPPSSRVVGIEVQGSTAWALVDTEQSGDTARQVAFFRQVEEGWLHTGPREQFWGAPQRKQTDHLLWLYRERDEDWVTGLLDDGETMYRQLGQELGISSSRPITIEVIYRQDTQQALYPTTPVLVLPSPLLAGTDEQDMRYELGLVLTEHLSVRTSGWRLGWEADSRGALLSSIIAWEARRVTGSGLDDQGAGQLADAIAANELLSLGQVWRDLAAVGSSGLRYAQGWTAVDYIATRHGPQYVTSLVQQLGAAASADDALKQVLGYQDLREFEAGWLEFVRDRYGRKE